MENQRSRLEQNSYLGLLLGCSSQLLEYLCIVIYFLVLKEISVVSFIVDVIIVVTSVQKVLPAQLLFPLKLAEHKIEVKNPEPFKDRRVRNLLLHIFSKVILEPVWFALHESLLLVLVKGINLVKQKNNTLNSSRSQLLLKGKLVRLHAFNVNGLHLMSMLVVVGQLNALLSYRLLLPSEVEEGLALLEATGFLDFAKAELFEVLIFCTTTEPHNQLSVLGDFL